MQLVGKKILLFVASFHDYHKLIKAELEKQGAVVCMIENRWPEESFRYSTNFFLTLRNRIRNPFYLSKHTKDVLRVVEGQTFDFMVALGGFSPSRKFVKYIKTKNPHISTRIFFWDSFKYWKIQHLRKWFDKAFSFDQLDCKKYSDLIYQPDFYIGAHCETVTPPKYDLSHIGSSHMFAYDRIEILDKLKRQADSMNLKSYIMVYDNNKVDGFGFKLLSMTRLNWYRYRKMVKKYINNGILTNHKLAYNTVLEIESQSVCIIDIPPIKQSGATIRALEAIASSKKLLTTNQYIKNELFYRSENIAILDRDNPTINVEFLKTPMVNVNIEPLRLDNWIKTILT